MHRGDDGILDPKLSFDKDSSKDDDMVKIIIIRLGLFFDSDMIIRLGLFFDSDIIIRLGLFFDSVSLLLVAHTLYNVTIDWSYLYRESIASRRLQPLMIQK